MLTGIRTRQCRIVVAWEASRYYRDLEVYVRLRNACAESGVLLCYNGVVYDLSKREDRKATALDAVQAEDEAEGIRDRNLRTHLRLAEQCLPVGPPPFGYVRRYDPDTGELIDQVPHPVRGPLVTEGFERCAAGRSVYSIGQWLSSLPDARRPGDKPWNHARVLYMLRNRAYIGRRIHRGKDMGKAAWKRLVSDELFYTVQRILGSPSRRGPRDSRVRHRLAYLAICGEHEDYLPSSGLITTGSCLPAGEEDRAWLSSAEQWYALVRQLYVFGFRPSLSEIRHALRKEDGAPYTSSVLATLREEVERREPQLAALPYASPPTLRCGPRRGFRTYFCPAWADTALNADRFEAYIEEAVVRWLRSDAAIDIFRSDRAARTAARAQARVSALTAQLTEARELAGQLDADNRPRLSAGSLADLERRILPQLQAATAEADVSGPPPLLQPLVGRPDTELAWSRLDIPQQRKVLRQIVTIRLFRASRRGVRFIAPGRVRLSFIGQPGFRGQPPSAAA